MSYVQYNSKGQYHGACQFKEWSVLYDNGVPISATLVDDTVIKIDKNTIITNYKIVFRNDAGKIHRADGPAIIYPDGYKEWWINGKKHRVDGPSITSYGDKLWYINGQYYGYSDEPPKEYLQALVDQGYIKHVDAFVRGSDDPW